MRSPSNSKLAPLAFWVAATSVALAVVGSSTLLFPGPDIGDPPSTPAGRDIVTRVIAPLFEPSPARERVGAPPSSPEAPASDAIAVVPAALVTVPTGVTQERPVRDRGSGITTRRPGGDGPAAARDGEGKGKSQAKGKGKSQVKSKARPAKASKDQPPRGKAIAGAKSQGHAYGHLRSTTSRGPKQHHVRPAKGHGKAKGRARAHARAGR
jgi:hypothetical protein